ncbi:MAG: MoaD/ThiS family protein [Actinomycetota bacterium]
MSIAVKVPTQLRDQTGGQAELSIDAAPDLRALIGVLKERHPELVERMLGDDGEIRRFINIYVGDEDVRFLDGLDTKLGESETVSILPAVAGGSA